MKTCDICSWGMRKVFTKKVLDRYDVDYYQCSNCHLLQTEVPYWLNESYKNPIATTDTGYVGRNILMSRISLIILYTLFKAKDKFLDYAGGYGLLARIMNDYGLTFFWMDKYTEGIFASGLEYSNERINAITCFECFEHFYNPTEECSGMLKMCKTIIFSTKLIPADTIPDVDTWGYYSFYDGQHVTLYSEKSLRSLSRKFGLNFNTDGNNIHMITDKKINNLLFRIVLFLPKLQIDILIRKLIKLQTSILRKKQPTSF